MTLATLPFPIRKQGIIDKLDYAASELERLRDALYKAHEQPELLRFASQTAETVLGNVRECFDHLGMDLIEGWLLPCAKPSFLRKFEKGKVNAYFPFYVTMLEQPEEQERFAFALFKRTHRPIYEELKLFVTALDANSTLNGYRVSDLRAVREMVNEKKHAGVLEYKAHPNEEVHIQGADSFVRMERKHLAGVTITVPGAIEGHYVPAYRFVWNNRDVASFCGNAIGATRCVMDRFYDAFFAPTLKVAPPPSPPPKITVSDKPNPDGPLITLDVSQMRPR